MVGAAVVIYHETSQLGVGQALCEPPQAATILVDVLQHDDPLGFQARGRAPCIPTTGGGFGGGLPPWLQAPPFIERILAFADTQGSYSRKITLWKTLK